MIVYIQFRIDTSYISGKGQTNSRVLNCFLLSSFAGPSISSTMWFRLIIKLIGWDRATGESSGLRPQQRAGAGGGGKGGGGTR